MSATSNDSKSVAIYCRISRADKDDQGSTSTDSVESQERRCRAYAEQQGWTVAEVYTDNSISGGRRDRPEFKRLQSELEAVDVVLAIDKDRLSRELFTDLEFRDLCLKADTQIWTISEGYENPDDSLMSNIKASVAEDYRKQVSRKQKSRIKDRKTQGQLTPGRFRLFGYADKHKTAKNPAESKLVEQVFEMVAAGNSNFVIMRMLNDSGTTTVTGKRWVARHVRLMVTNPAYKGWIYGTDGELMTKQAQWSPIVSVELWDRANRKIAKRKKFDGRGNPKRLLSGLLYCGGYFDNGDLCLTKMVVGTKGDSVRYRCQAGAGCGSVSIKADWADQFISQEAIKPLLEALPKREEKPVDHSEEIAAIDARLERLMLLFEDGDLAKDQYRQKRDSLKSEKDALLEQTNSASNLGTYELFVSGSVDAQRETAKLLFPNGISVVSGSRSKHYNTDKLRERFIF